MWEIVTVKAQGNQTYWMAMYRVPILLSCLELGHKSPTRTSSHTLIVSYQQWTISSSPEGRPWCHHRAESALGPGPCTQAGYHQGHQFPGASHVSLAISVCLFSGVEAPGKWQSQETNKSSCPILPCVILWSADYIALWAKSLSPIPSPKMACE